MSSCTATSRSSPTWARRSSRATRPAGATPSARWWPSRRPSASACSSSRTRSPPGTTASSAAATRCLIGRVDFTAMGKLGLALALLVGVLAAAEPAAAQSVSEFPGGSGGLPANVAPTDIALGPDGNTAYFTELFGTAGSMTTGGAATQYPAGLPAAGIDGISTGPDANLWMGAGASAQETSQIARMTPTG